MVNSTFLFAYISLTGLSKPCKDLLSTLLCTVILAVSWATFKAIVVLVLALGRNFDWPVPNFIWRPHSTGVFSLCTPVYFILYCAQCSYFVLYGATILIGVHCYFHITGLKGN